MDGAPWLCVPFAEVATRKESIGKKVPCTGYPTPGIINAKTGEVYEADAWNIMGGA